MIRFEWRGCVFVTQDVQILEAFNLVVIHYGSNQMYIPLAGYLAAVAAAMPDGEL